MPLIEATYRLDATEAWLDGVVEAAAPLGDELGVFVVAEHVAGGRFERRGHRTRGAGWLDGFVDTITPRGRAMVPLLFERVVTCGSLRDIAASTTGGSEVAAPFLSAARAMGIHDVWGITAATGGETLSIVWPWSSAGSPPTVDVWPRLGLHIAAALRLRSRARSIEPGAIVGPGASCDGETLWQALVSGGFTPVDRVERGGRRYLLAIENPVAGWAVRDLNEVEREVVHAAVGGLPNKAIGAALGLSTGAVGASLSRAMRKLTVHNRSELKVLAGCADVGLDAARAACREVGYVAIPLGADPDVRPRSGDRARGLTGPQAALLAHVADGRTNREIAALLGISPNTVRNRIVMLCERLGVATRSELACAMLAPLRANVPSTPKSEPA